ncbi:MAG: glycosyltransferase family 4 protein [Planctomycetaceae bacterium]|jgi:glycosyltransferase involved in cell wall biosynthesis|nr:glycosyltransferase family 4 protein [Planctomycetaceae bacterium]
MRILIFTHNYFPEGNALASRFTAMCQHWVALGHEVQVITNTPNFPAGQIFDGYKNKFVQHEIIDGVHVTRVWTYVTPNKGTLKRMVSFIVFMFMAVWIALFQKRPDIIIGSSPQFFAAWAGLISSRLHWHRVPFIAEIRDLWPDSIVAVGAMKNKKLLAIIYWLEKLLYRKATHLVTVGPGYAEDLKDKNVPEEKISIIPNGVDKELFLDKLPDENFRTKYNLENKTACAYIGTIGMAAGLEIVLNAAEQLQKLNRNDIIFFLIGEGAEREILQKDAENRQLNNVIFTGMIPKNNVPEILAAIDICFVHLKKKPLFTRVLPSKIFEMAAMKKPIILGVEGFAAQLIREANAGICIEPENTNNFLEALELLVQQPELRESYGEHGQQYVLKYYNRQHLAEKYIQVMESIIYSSNNNKHQ